MSVGYVDERRTAAPSESSPRNPSLNETSPSGAARPVVRPAEAAYEEFNYRPVPVLAAVGLVLSLLSVAGVFVWLALPLGLISLALSAMALVTIRQSEGAYGGALVAVSGIFLSLLFFCGGIALQVYTYQTEVPDGYERVSFVREISSKGFVEHDGMQAVHPEIAALEGKKIFVKGFIYQTGKMEGLSSFLFVKDNESCCFGANPALTDQIAVVMEEGKAIQYHPGKVAVAGTFRLNPNYTPGSEQSIYMLEGEHFSTRVSDF